MHHLSLIALLSIVSIPLAGATSRAETSVMRPMGNLFSIELPDGFETPNVAQDTVEDELIGRVLTTTYATTRGREMAFIQIDQCLDNTIDPGNVEELLNLTLEGTVKASMAMASNRKDFQIDGHPALSVTVIGSYGMMPLYCRYLWVVTPTSVYTVCYIGDKAEQLQAAEIDRMFESFRPG